MYRNPKHYPDESIAEMPQERGSRLATFPRGPDQELRVCLEEFKGHQFVSLRVWDRGGDGVWRPVRNKGCSVRLAECDGLLEALARFADRPPGPGAGRLPSQAVPSQTDDTPRYVEKRRQPRRFDPDALPRVGTADQGGQFNEFDDY